MSDTETEKDKKLPLFRDINADDPEPETSNIESVCMNCFKNGTTRLLLTKIPFYKEVVIMSFTCDYCGYQNNEIQSAGEIQPKGCRYTLNVKTQTDLNRKIVKSDYSCVKIPEVDLEIPSQSQKGEITTIEGIIERTITGLEQDQETRRKDHPDIAKQIDDYIEKLRNLKNIEEGKNNNFTLIIEDISGNSFIENPFAPKSDPDCTIHYFQRTEEQNKILGIYSPSEVNDDDNDGKDNKTNKPSDEKDKLLKPMPEGSWTLEDLHGEVLQFSTLCPSCRSPCETNMKLTKIPHFKEVVIMATVCEICGCKTNEVKSGGGIEEKGVRFEVLVNNKEDLNRDVLKSETCSLRIPELDCDVGPAALVGRFTTVEGVLTAMKEQLEESGTMFHDSQDVETKRRISKFIQEIDKVIALDRQVTLILDDPAGNSYVQSLKDDDEPDEKLKIIKYTRTFEQNEELGLNDMKTENYEEN